MDYIKIPLYLSGPNATVDRTDSVTIGTAGSYGVHAFEVERGRNWDNLSIKATFYQKPDDGENTTTPSDEVIQITVVETGDGLIPIPNELFETETDEVGSTQPQTWVTFSGYDGENLKMNSLRLMLEISDTGPTYSTAFTPTPDIEEQLINAVKEIRDAACECATQAGEYSFEAAKSATAAKTSEQNAYNSEINAASSELAAELSAQAAEASELNAKQSETIVDGLIQKAENLYEEGASKIEAVFEDSKEEVENIFNEGATKVENIFNEGTTKIQELTNSAKDSSDKAEEYAKQAKESADAAKNSQDAALASETNAKTSETNAAKSASDAAISATTAGQSETNALGYANRASAQATAAAESQRDAATSRDAAATSANSARTYMLDAKDYRDDAQTAAESTIGYATQVSGSASAAQTSASKAATSEKNAHTSEVNAAGSASISDKRATEAATSASNAAISAQDAADSLADMEDLVAHMPQINPVNELWQTWNAEEGQYEDTGVLARGQGVAKGGQPGQVLVKNSVANYDTTWVDRTEAIDTPVYSLVKQDIAEDGYFATYYMTKNNVQEGPKINIPKDYLVKEAELLEVTEVDTPYSGAAIGDKYIDFTINTQASDEDEQHIYLPVKDLVDTYVNGDGINIIGNVISVKLDTANANGLAVDTNGIKLNLATSTTAGAMSGPDKAKLDASSTTEQMNQAISSAIDEALEDPAKLPFVNINGDTMHGSLTTTELFTDFVTIRNAGTDGNTGFQNNSDTDHIRVYDKVANTLVPIEVGEPVNNQDASTKKYVDDKVTTETAARTEAIESLDEAKADKDNPTFTGIISGANATLSGTLTGNTATFSGGITVPLEPGAEGSATSKKYVDDQIAVIDVSEQIEPLTQRVTTAEGEIDTLQSNIVSITNGTTELPYIPSDGGTISGPINWGGNPQEATELANKAYVDANDSDAVNSAKEYTNAQIEIAKGYTDEAVTNLTNGTTELPYVTKEEVDISGSPQEVARAYRYAFNGEIDGTRKSSGFGFIDLTPAIVTEVDGSTSFSPLYIGEPEKDSQATTKKYVDDAIAAVDVSEQIAPLTERVITAESDIDGLQTEISNIKDGTTELSYLKDSGDTATGVYDFTGATLNIAEPTENTNPATKSYVDTKIANIGEGGEVVAYTNGNGITISADNVISVNVNTSGANGLSVDTNGLKLDLATSTTSGAMSSADKIKLDAAPTTETVEASISEAVNALGIDEIKQDITTLEAAVDNIPVVSASETNGNIKIDETDTTVYTHPTYTETQEGFYKVTVDKQGHVTTTTAVVKEDITNLGIPAQDTTYTDATTTKSGLMSATDKIALNTAVEDIVDIKEDYVSNGSNNTAKGNPAVYNNSVEWPLQGLKVYGKSTQISSQLLPLTESSYSSNGLTATLQEDGSLIVNGTPTTVPSNVIYIPLNLSPGDYYIAGGENTAGHAVTLIEIKKNTGTNYWSNQSFSVDGTETSIVFMLQSVFANAINNYRVPAMLNKGTKPLPVQKYNGTPSPENPIPIVSAGGDGNVDVSMTGKNLLNISKMQQKTTNGITFSLESGGIKINGTATANTDSPVFTFRLPAGTYISNINRTQFPWIFSASYVVEKKGGSMRWLDADVAFTVLDEDVGKYFYFVVEEGKTVNEIIYPQLELGSVSTDYEPYTSQSLTVSTPNGLPGIPVTSGGNYTDVSGQQWVCDVKDYGTGKYTQMVGHIESYNSENITTPYMSTTGQLSTGAEVYYVLDEPVVTDISADELTAYRTLHTYDGTTVISSTDPLAEIEFNYVSQNQTNLPYIKNKGDTVSGDYDFTSAVVKVAEPVEDKDAATKGYVDENTSPLYTKSSFGVNIFGYPQGEENLGVFVDNVKTESSLYGLTLYGDSSQKHYEGYNLLNPDNITENVGYSDTGTSETKQGVFSIKFVFEEGQNYEFNVVSNTITGSSFEDYLSQLNIFYYNAGQSFVKKETGSLKSDSAQLINSYTNSTNSGYVYIELTPKEKFALTEEFIINNFVIFPANKYSSAYFEPYTGKNPAPSLAYPIDIMGVEENPVLFDFGQLYTQINSGSSSIDFESLGKIHLPTITSPLYGGYLGNMSTYSESPNSIVNSIARASFDNATICNSGLEDRIYYIDKRDYKKGKDIRVFKTLTINPTEVSSYITDGGALGNGHKFILNVNDNVKFENYSGNSFNEKEEKLLVAIPANGFVDLHETYGWRQRIWCNYLQSADYEFVNNLVEENPEPTTSYDTIYYDIQKGDDPNNITISLSNIAIYTTRATTVEEFAAFITTPMQIVYALDEPVETDIPEDELLNLDNIHIKNNSLYTILSEDINEENLNSDTVKIIDFDITYYRVPSSNGDIYPIESLNTLKFLSSLVLANSSDNSIEINNIKDKLTIANRAVFIGDSTSQGYDNDDYSFVDIFKENGDFSGVAKLAVGGATLGPYQIVSEASGYSCLEQIQAHESGISGANFCFLQFCANDVKCLVSKNVQIGTPSDASTMTTVCGYLKKCIELLYTYNPTISIVFINLATNESVIDMMWDNEVDSDADKYKFYHKVWNLSIADVLEQYNIPMINIFDWTGINANNFSNYTVHTEDSTHLNTAGNTLAYYRIKNALWNESEKSYPTQPKNLIIDATIGGNIGVENVERIKNAFDNNIQVFFNLKESEDSTEDLIVPVNFSSDVGYGSYFTLSKGNKLYLYELWTNTSGQITDISYNITDMKSNIDTALTAGVEKLETLESYSDETYTIDSMKPNTLYNLRKVDLPTITVTAFEQPANTNYVWTYHMIFQSNVTPVTLNLPNSVVYPEDFGIETKHIYEINIMDNLLSYQSWPME